MRVRIISTLPALIVPSARRMLILGALPNAIHDREYSVDWLGRLGAQLSDKIKDRPGIRLNVPGILLFQKTERLAVHRKFEDLLLKVKTPARMELRGLFSRDISEHAALIALGVLIGRFQA
jgi:hypothetical protein